MSRFLSGWAPVPKGIHNAPPPSHHNHSMMNHSHYHPPQLPPTSTCLADDEEHDESQPPLRPTCNDDHHEDEEEEEKGSTSKNEFQDLLDQSVIHKSPSRTSVQQLTKMKRSSSRSIGLTKPNARVAAVGRALLERPKKKPIDAREVATRSVAFQSLTDCNTRRVSDHGVASNVVARKYNSTIFTACSANTPVKYCAGTTVALTSCLSLSSMANRRTLSLVDGAENAAVANEEFKPFGRKVSFSHSRVREYEITLGDNPSVSSGIPLSLGWRYNPRENISSLDDDNDSADRDTSGGFTQRRRSTRELRLSNEERYHRLLHQCNANLSMDDITDTLQATKMARLERKLSLTELKNEMLVSKRQEKEKEAQVLVRERTHLRRRRAGIVDGGLAMSTSMLTL